MRQNAERTKAQQSQYISIQINPLYFDYVRENIDPKYSFQ